MKKFICFLNIIALFLLVSTSVNATTVTLNFDDLASNVPIVTNYGGLTWDSSWYSWYSLGSPWYPPESDPNVLYSHSAAPNVLFGQNVTFLGSWIAMADIGQTIWWEGYQNGTKLYESNHVSGAYQGFMSLNWSGIDEVKYVTSGDANYSIIDDFEYETQSSNSVPEPATMLLFGLGLMGLAGVRRKLKK